MSNPEETRALDPAEFPELPKSRQRMEVTLLLARAEKAEAELERFAERVAGELDARVEQLRTVEAATAVGAPFVAEAIRRELTEWADLIRNSAKGEG